MLGLRFAFRVIVAITATVNVWSAANAAQIVYSLSGDAILQEVTVVRNGGWGYVEPTYYPLGSISGAYTIIRDFLEGTSVYPFGEGYGYSGKSQFASVSLPSAVMSLFPG